MKVLFASSECSPFVKVGGLADVVGSLPVELNKQGVDARVIIPLYKKIKV
ncbi:MAG: glycogen/starch synthase, partial [Clostridiales bacterium]|nr:glycogen/starch synthase [Clostridiales bacterium]